MLLRKIVCTLSLLSVATPNESGKEDTSIKDTSYDPGELLAKIFNPNTTISSRQRGYSLVFEDQRDTSEDHGQYGLLDNKRLKFEEDPNYSPVRFQDEDQSLVHDQATFQDDNAIDQGNKKRRRRRRKPKKGLQNYGGSYPGDPNLHGVPGSPGFSGLGPNPYPVNPGFGSQYVNPGFSGPAPYRRRRRPSLASDALTAVTGALTSIALYDDYQCVPRLLCEAAGGGSLGSNGVLNSIAGIQPLLTLLSAYNGLSTSPLFIFGRAVFLGMTSRGNTGTCRYAYPQCPTDPEELIHYLNNHNGGFFRFFNAPLPNQNLEQFYNHLGQNGQFNVQNFGQISQLGQYQQNQGYGLSHNGQNLGQNGQQFQQGYGLYQNYPSEQGYGFQNNHIGNQRPSYGQNYGSSYDYNTYGSNIRFKDSNAQIEKRIQNKPGKSNDDFEDSANVDSNWQFPDDAQPNFDDIDPINSYNFDDNADRDSNSLKFPEESENYDDKGDSKRKGKSILFPENQYNHNAYSNNYLPIGNQNRENTRKPYNQNNYNNKVTTGRPYYQNNYNNHQYNNYISNTKYIGTTEKSFDENDYYFDHKHNFYVKKDNPLSHNNNYKYQVNNNNIRYESNKGNYNSYVNSNEAGVQTVYIVRGNGDPSRPEIVKVRPGQAVN